ncbi:MAG TPA: formylmethanofuran dehydrogenase subunit E family protein [Thermoguttaceae bacterium]|nr:formylmethanofuran dehydrogenase subunit E family protein [Thermoguttaceae bacterium]
MHRLPQPHYERLGSDPEWLAYAAQFHGHLGPWATAGTRLGMAGLREVDAKGYFDVEVICEGPFLKPPKSCFLDGIQVATGATWGKRNLHCGRTPTDEIVVRVRNVRTGAQAEARPTAKLMDLLGSFQPRVKAAGANGIGQKTQDDRDADHAVEALAREIAAIPDCEILVVSRTEDARQHE